MTDSELLKLLKQTTIGLRQYREALRTKQASGDKCDKILEAAQSVLIKQHTKSLLKEAFMLGPSGQVCPRCSGSGRI